MSTMAAYLAFYFSNAILALTRRSNYLAVFLFVALNLWFVGFRYEVGFDWEIYKSQFEYFSQVRVSDFFSEFSFFQEKFTHESGFLLLAYIASQIFSTYEMFHLAIFALFFSSVLILARSMGSRNIIASFLIIHLFLLFTLEFSTLRQIAAISVFNIGLSRLLRGGGYLAYGYMIAAPFFHVSAIMYLLFLLAANGSSLRVWAYLLPLLALAIVIAIAGFSQLPLVGSLGSVGAKLIWYFELREVNQNIFEQIFFLTFYPLIAIWAFFNFRKKSLPTGSNALVAKMVFVMAISALVFFGVNVIRNRILYELVILVSLAAFSDQARLNVYLRPILLSWGAVFLAAALVKPSSFVFVPYQNYVVHEVLNLESDGAERQARLRHIIATR